MMPASTTLAQPTSRRSGSLGSTARVGESVDPAKLDLAALVRRSLSESELFYHGQPHDTRFSYELFRRALVERNEQAWEHIFTSYGSLVESWVRRSGAFASSGESSEYFVGAAFTRFWRAVASR